MPKLVKVGKSKHRKKIVLHCVTQVSWWTGISIGLNFSTLFIPENNLQWAITLGGAGITLFLSHHIGKRRKWF